MQLAHPQKLIFNPKTKKSRLSTRFSHYKPCLVISDKVKSILCSTLSLPINSIASPIPGPTIEPVAAILIGIKSFLP